VRFDVWWDWGFGITYHRSVTQHKLRALIESDRINMVCIFMLPYFCFAPLVGEDPDGIYAQSDLFLLNTEAALRYYVNQAQEIFSNVYLLGN
jgi:hypothetical protein